MRKFIRNNLSRFLVLVLISVSLFEAPAPTRWVLIIGLIFLLILEDGFGVNKKPGSDEPKRPPGHGD